MTSQALLAPTRTTTLDSDALWEEILAPTPQRKAASDAAWARMLERLIAYKAEHGDVLPSKTLVFDGVHLGSWLIRQRAAFRAGELSADRTELLEKVGVSWENQKLPWDDAFEILVAYKAEHGDVNAPDGCVYRGLPLGTWLQTQRRAYRLGVIVAERVAQLEALGMVWAFGSATWERNLALVVEYKKRHGTANVPVWFDIDGVKLGSWMKNQRSAHKKGTMPAERQKRLATLGVRL